MPYTVVFLIAIKSANDNADNADDNANEIETFLFAAVIGLIGEVLTTLSLVYNCRPKIIISKYGLMTNQAKIIPKLYSIATLID